MFKLREYKISWNRNRHFKKSKFTTYKHTRAKQTRAICLNFLSVSAVRKFAPKADCFLSRKSTTTTTFWPGYSRFFSLSAFLVSVSLSALCALWWCLPYFFSGTSNLLSFPVFRQIIRCTHKICVTSYHAVFNRLVTSENILAEKKKATVTARVHVLTESERERERRGNETHELCFRRRTCTTSI